MCGSSKWVTYYQECDVFALRIFQDIIATTLDGLPIGNNYFSSVESFLSGLSENQHLELAILLCKLTNFSLSTSKMLVYASRYTRSALLTTFKPFTVISVSSARPKPTR